MPKQPKPTKETIKKLTNKAWRMRSQKIYHIKDRRNLIIPYKRNKAQQDFTNKRWYFNIILKSRRLGFSTECDLSLLDDTLWKPQDNLIIAHTREDAERLFEDKIMTAYTNLPPEIKQLWKVDSERANRLKFDWGSITDPKTKKTVYRSSSVTVANSGRSGGYSRVHVCLHPDTNIVTKNGYTQKIKDITPNTLVLTSKGSYQKVVHNQTNPFKDVKQSLYEIKTFGNTTPLLITGDHKVLARNQYRRKENTGNAKWVPTKELTTKHYIAYPSREISNKMRNPYLKVDKDTNSPDINYDLGYFVGLYLAEGHIKRRKYQLKKENNKTKIYESEIIIAAHRKEIPRLKKHVELFQDFYNSYRITDHKDSLTSTITVNSKPLIRFLRKFFIDPTTGDKYIPDAVWNYGREFVDGLVKGYFDGDGSYRNTSVIQVTSVRKQLIIQMKLLLISLRYGYPSIYRKEAQFYKGREEKESWVLKLYGEGNERFRRHYGLPLPPPTKRNRKLWRRGDDYYWSQITSIKKLPNTDPRVPEFVHDLVLEKDPHNYVTTNGVVHNSEFGKICAKFPERAREILSGTIPTIPYGGQLDIESTAEGEVGPFHDMFWDAWNKPYNHLPLAEYKKHAKKNEFKAHFYNWTWDEEEINKLKDPIPLSKMDNQQHFANYQKLHNFTPIQLTFYYLKYKSLNSDMKLLRQEYPTTPLEAFESAGDKMFDQDRLSKQLSKAIKPLHTEGPWKIYKEPVSNHEYAMGIDTSEGIGGDNAAISIIDFTTPPHLPPEVVATFKNNFTPPDMLAHEAKIKGLLYNTAFIIPEINNHGHALVQTLKDIYPTDQIYTRVKQDKYYDEETEKLGWQTNISTRSQMFSDFNTAINEEAITLNSEELIKECKTFPRQKVNQVRTKDDGTLGHWDLLTATTLAYQGKDHTASHTDAHNTYIVGAPEKMWYNDNDTQPQPFFDPYAGI